MRRLLTILALLIMIGARAQTAGDPKWFFKASGAGDQVGYVTKVNNTFYHIKGNGTFGLLPVDSFATAHHVHTFASLTSKPTTIAGYGITDFNSLGDARWTQIGHKHPSSDITDASTGGNGVSDAGKVLLFGANGGIRGSAATGTAVTATSTASATGIDVTTVNGSGVQVVSTAGTPFVGTTGNTCAAVLSNNSVINTVLLTNQGGGGFLNCSTGAADVLTIGNDGTITWNGGAGAAGTRTTLGLGTLATQSGTFSGTHSGNSSGTNTGDQTSIVGISGSLAEFNTALTGADFATGGGTVTGTSSGTNTGDQTITLTGDVTGTGTGSFATTVDPAMTKVWSGNHTFRSGTLGLADTDNSARLQVNAGSDLSTTRTLTLTTGDADRTLTLSGNATISGTNSGDVTLAGTPDYITLSGQVITRTKLDLVDDLNTFSSANFATNCTDEAGSGKVMMGTSGVEAAYTGTITWTAGAAPSGTLNQRQFYTQVGNMVTWQISLTYATQGTTVTNVVLTFPTEFPTPAIPTGFTGASVHVWNCASARFYTTPSGTLTNGGGFVINRNAGDTGFEISSAAFTSSTVRTAIFSGVYFTQ